MSHVSLYFILLLSKVHNPRNTGNVTTMLCIVIAAPFISVRQFLLYVSQFVVNIVIVMICSVTCDIYCTSEGTLVVCPHSRVQGKGYCTLLSLTWKLRNTVRRLKNTAMAENPKMRSRFLPIRSITKPWRQDKNKKSNIISDAFQGLSMPVVWLQSYLKILLLARHPGWQCEGQSARWFTAGPSTFVQTKFKHLWSPGDETCWLWRSNDFSSFIQCPYGGNNFVFVKGPTVRTSQQLQRSLWNLVSFMVSSDWILITLVTRKPLIHHQVKVSFRLITKYLLKYNNHIYLAIDLKLELITEVPIQIECGSGSGAGTRKYFDHFLFFLRSYGRVVFDLFNNSWIQMLKNHLHILGNNIFEFVKFGTAWFNFRGSVVEGFRSACVFIALCALWWKSGVWARQEPIHVWSKYN